MNKAKKAPEKKAASKTRTPKAFFATGRRGPRGVERIPLHVLITAEQRAKLAKLSHKRELNCADVVRELIDAAKA